MMPWKEEKDPYKIWISEIILQQTRVAQAEDKYLNFIFKFPNIKVLAKANVDEVLNEWEGLGYYSRAKNLHYTAKYLVEKNRGIFPESYQEILNLKGIGPYTAAAIASFAFNKVEPVIDGNVVRVLSRIFGLFIKYKLSSEKKTFFNIAFKLIDKNNPAKYNQAIMDFGATVCTPKNPKCNQCPFHSSCFAFIQNKIEELPLKTKKPPLKNRYFYAYLVDTPKGYLIEKREAKDVWQHLYQLPMVEVTGYQNDKKEQAKKVLKDIFYEYKDQIKTTSDTFIQKLSHQKIHIRFSELEIKTLNLKSQQVFTKDFTKFAFPKTFLLYFEQKKLLLSNNIL